MVVLFMNRNNILKILKTHFDLRFSHTVIIFAISFLFIYFSIPKYKTVYNNISYNVSIFDNYYCSRFIILFSVAIFPLYLSAEEKINFNISGCSRKEIVMSNFIINILISMILLSFYILSFVIYKGFDIFNINNDNFQIFIFDLKNIAVLIFISSLLSAIFGFWDFKDNYTLKKRYYLLIGFLASFFENKIIEILYTPTNSLNKVNIFSNLKLNMVLCSLIYLMILIIIYFVNLYFFEKKSLI